MMASAQVAETSVNTNHSPSQDYTAKPDDHSNHNSCNCVVSSSDGNIDGDSQVSVHVMVVTRVMVMVVVITMVI